MFSAALFDLDGTLVMTEWQYDIFWNDIARRFRPDIADMPMLVRGQPTAQSIARHIPPEHQAEVTRLLDEHERTMEYTFVEGALSFLRQLRAEGIRTAVVTSSNRLKMSYVAAAVPGFDGLFDRVLTAEDFSAPKPAPDCYLRGAEVFSLRPADCVVFEDAPAGLQAGMSSGCFTVGIATSLTVDQLRSRCHHPITDFVGLTPAIVSDWLQ